MLTYLDTKVPVGRGTPLKLVTMIVMGCPRLSSYVLHNAVNRWSVTGSGNPKNGLFRRWFSRGSTVHIETNAKLLQTIHKVGNVKCFLIISTV